MLCSDGTLSHESCRHPVWVGWILNNCLPLLPKVSGNKQLIYSWLELLQLCSSIIYNTKPAANHPPKIHPRERGGVHTRLRKHPFRAPIPSIVVANVRSLQKKWIYCMPNAGWSRPSKIHPSLPWQKPGLTWMSRTQRSVLPTLPSCGLTRPAGLARTEEEASESLSTNSGAQTSKYAAQHVHLTWNC